MHIYKWFDAKSYGLNMNRWQLMEMKYLSPGSDQFTSYVAESFDFPNYVSCYYSTVTFVAVCTHCYSSSFHA